MPKVILRDLNSGLQQELEISTPAPMIATFTEATPGKMSEHLFALNHVQTDGTLVYLFCQRKIKDYDRP